MCVLKIRVTGKTVVEGLVGSNKVWHISEQPCKGRSLHALPRTTYSEAHPSPDVAIFGAIHHQSEVLL